MASHYGNNDLPPPYTLRSAPPVYTTHPRVSSSSPDRSRISTRNFATDRSARSVRQSPVADVSAHIPRILPIAVTRYDNDHSRLPFEFPARPMPTKSYGQDNDAHIDIPAAREANRPLRHLHTQTAVTVNVPHRKLSKWRNMSGTGFCCIVISVLLIVAFFVAVIGLHLITVENRSKQPKPT